jgi:hypothetical protein
MRYLNTKPGSIEEVAANMSKYAAESEYQDMFKKELEKAGKGIGGMTPAEKKAFFNKIDSKYKAKDEAVNEDVNESASQVQVKRDGKGNFNLMFRGKEIGYYHKSGSKYMVYYDNEDGDYNQSDEVSSEMQAKKLAYDNMNEEVSQKDVDKFHTSLDKLVHKSFGYSSDEKKKEMKNETHSFVTNKQNEKQKKADGEKDIVDPAPEMKKESLYDSIKSVWQMSAEQLEKIKSKAKYYKKEQNKNDLKSKKVADTGSESTPVDTEPKVDYTN